MYMFDRLFFTNFILNKPLVNPFHCLLHRLDKFIHLISDDVWSQKKIIHNTYYFGL